jgi:thiol-disulfide isomerase/thioredoxin
MSRRIRVALTMVVASLAFFAFPIAVSGSGLNQSTGGDASLTLKDMSGREQSLKELRGKIVVLNFWATWCVPCREEMTVLVTLQKQYESQGVQVIGASADEASTQENIPEFARKVKINFPIWVGATVSDMQRLQLGDALPATAIIDRDGQIVGRILGPVEKDDLRKRVEWLLSDRRSPAPPALVNNLEKLKREHAGHEHGGVSIEGASSVPS